MHPKIRCDGNSIVLLQNFLDIYWAKEEECAEARAAHAGRQRRRVVRVPPQLSPLVSLSSSASAISVASDL
jgi:hypothetical protein